MDTISYTKAIEALKEAQNAYQKATQAMAEFEGLFDEETLLAEGIRTTATNLYLQISNPNGWVRCTDDNGYNDGSPNYMPIIASEFRIPSPNPQLVTEDRIQSGRELVTLTANETTNYHVDFPNSFNGTPIVTAVYGTSVPYKMSPIGITDVTETGFNIRIQRDNDTATYVDWIAIDV